MYFELLDISDQDSKDALRVNSQQHGSLRRSEAQLYHVSLQYRFLTNSDTSIARCESINKIIHKSLMKESEKKATKKKTEPRI